ncbi:MAG: ATPase [Novosphingobium sp. 17-62-19]|uniref:HdaA/DnaA family protein n=1 Tax=Novosphingobium sp. 17-62-19 TaxID=1970406 RepID=UPI000BD600AA|nr:DnaA/Hda family protein [Novosphingobium sp. 17-62-19]OZA18114.1 MAG: ATPase [Novosphingobium sp. 17-62-19]HQS97193.1 DnaA/Hda family protein [Novosphingobium sp.]
MSTQIALPLVTARGAETVVMGPSLVPVIEALQAAERWPFRTAILAGPPRSGKSLLARWFAESGAGEVVDGADALPEDEVFHRWNRAQADGRPLLLVADRAPGEWKVTLPDLASRLGAALLIEIAPPDDELVAGLVAELSARRGLVLGEQVLSYLLPRLERSYAEIELLIETLDRLSLERKAPVTISLVRDALSERTGEFQPRLL